MTADFAEDDYSTPQVLVIIVNGEDVTVQGVTHEEALTDVRAMKEAGRPMRPVSYGIRVVHRQSVEQGEEHWTDYLDVQEMVQAGVLLNSL
jgi:IMP cyclohydrolase